MTHERPASDPEWVVCLGVHRDVAPDGVRCPRTRSAIAVTECLACRHLAAAADERGSAEWCTTGEFELPR